MSAPKGYPSQTKDARVGAQFATVEPINQDKYGLTVIGHLFNFIVGTDAVEANPDANSQLYRIVATAHAVLKGDVIRFTSGALNGVEVKVHSVVDANTFDLVENLSVAPSVADTFEILRNKAPVINSDGTLFTSSAGNISFLRDSVSTTVEEDTVTPANNRPLPVKLTGVTGDITITANDLNVQLDHANDSVRIGDGTEIMLVNVDGSINSVVTATDLDIRDLSAAQDNVAISDGVDTMAVNADGSINAVVTATDLDVRDLSHTQDSIRVGDGVDLLAVNADGSINVVSTATDLDIRDLSAAQDNVAISDGVDTLAVNADGSINITDNGASITVDTVDLDIRDLSQATDSVAIGDGTDIIAISAAGEASVQVTQPLPAGANNIGDVDVLTQPARSHTTDSIRIGDGVDLVNVTAANQMEVAVTAALPTGSNVIGQVQISEVADIVDFLDTPVHDASSVNIPGSAGSPVQVVASLAANVRRILPNDTTGFYIGVYTGAAASEVLQCIIGPGADTEIPVQMLSGERVSLRAMATAAISVGELSIQFIG